MPKPPIVMRWWFILLSLAVCCAGVVAYLVRSFAPRLRRMAEERTELYFRTHFHSNVAISGFQVASVFPQLHVNIQGVELRQQGETGGVPVVQMERVTFEARTLSLFSHHPVVKAVRLDGLQVRIPPRPSGSPPLIGKAKKGLAERYPVVVQTVYVNDARLIILPRDPGKDPHEFDLHRLILGPLGFGRPAEFHADLTNPVPTGEIHSTGSFGPWDAEDPGATPVDGRYTFQDADMGTLKGLSGTLSSSGTFSGPLNFLAVEGQTDTPNFSLRTAHHPIDLHTRFSAIVDGTNGNTILNDVVAKFEHSTLDVKGEVVDKTPKRGRTIILDAVTDGATIQDLLHLAVDSNVMTGAARLQAKIDIGEGSADLIDRMKLSGQFEIAGARFTSPSTEQKIETLSLKGQGEPGAAPVGDPVSDFSGNLRVVNGVVTLSRLDFDVTGAAVALDGTYDLDSGQLDMRGKLRLQAKLSQTTTGVKSFFLKAVDPFFEGKDAGTVLPIKITGTKDNPSFGLDFRDAANRE
jgi:hypothetical protein